MECATSSLIREESLYYNIYTSRDSSDMRFKGFVETEAVKSKDAEY